MTICQVKIGKPWEQQNSCNVLLNFVAFVLIYFCLAKGFNPKQLLQVSCLNGVSKVFNYHFSKYQFVVLFVFLLELHWIEFFVYLNIQLGFDRIFIQILNALNFNVNIQISYPDIAIELFLLLILLIKMHAIHYKYISFKWSIFFEYMCVFTNLTIKRMYIYLHFNQLL